MASQRNELLEQVSDHSLSQVMNALVHLSIQTQEKTNKHIFQQEAKADITRPQKVSRELIQSCPAFGSLFFLFFKLSLDTELSKANGTNTAADIGRRWNGSRNLQSHTDWFLLFNILIDKVRLICRSPRTEKKCGYHSTSFFLFTPPLCPTPPYPAPPPSWAFWLNGKMCEVFSYWVNFQNWTLSAYINACCSFPGAAEKQQHLSCTAVV